MLWVSEWERDHREEGRGTKGRKRGEEGEREAAIITVRTGDVCEHMERAAGAETITREKTLIHQRQTEMDPLLRNLIALLLFVLPLLHTQLSTHAATISPPPTRRRIIHLTPMGSDDDYGDYEEDLISRVWPSSMKTPLLRSELCSYDPCKENQESCNVLAARTGCLCPGRSGDDQPPHAPRIQALLPVTEGENSGNIEVRWCAPSSVVSAYRVTVEGRDSDRLEFGDSSRLGSVGPLEVGTKVCVQAVNDAGQSSPSEFSCMRYTHSESSDHKLLVWIIAGGVALVLLLVAAVVIICKCQKTKRHSHDGLGNLSYSK